MLGALFVLLKKQRKIEANKIATMDSEFFFNYIATMFSNVLLLESDTRVSENEPNVLSVLSEFTMEKMFEYIGDDAIDAIDYYYGSDFLDGWIQLSLRILEEEGILFNVIRKTAKFNDVYKTIR